MSNFSISAAATLLIFVVLPLWIAAGLADYFCHRATSIETTSGTSESALHLAQFGLVGAPVTLALFFDINAGYFVLATVFLLLHHAVAAVDLVYANPRRRIAPREQMIHSFLEIMPLTALFLLAVLYWPQVLALVGKGSEAPVFAPQIRLLPISLISTILAAAFFLNILPYAEEFWRCVRQARPD